MIHDYLLTNEHFNVMNHLMRPGESSLQFLTKRGAHALACSRGGSWLQDRSI